MLKIIDVSKHQGVIKFDQINKSEISGVIIRAGYGMYVEDDKFRDNISGFIASGFTNIGVYWFIYALSTAQARENARRCMQVIAPYKHYINLKVWCDFEGDSDSYAARKGVTFSKAKRTDIVRAFLEEVKAGGYDVGIYANPDYLKNKFNDVSAYPLWLAKYASNKGSYDCFMWQYTSKGKVAGISGNVDISNLYNDSSFFPKYTGNSVSIVAALTSLGYNATYAYRKKIALTNGISLYAGTASQNTLLLTLLKQGILIKPE